MRFQRRIELAPHLWYQTGGRAEFYARISVSDCEQAFEICARRQLPLLILGEGSNMLVSEAGWKGLVLHLAHRRTSHAAYPAWRDAFCGVSGKLEPPHYKIIGSAKGLVKVTVAADTDLQELVFWSLKAGLIGLEWAAGLPGTVGAAVRGNVGAFGHEFADQVTSACAMNVAGGRITHSVLSRQALKFGYRESFIKRLKYLVSEVTLEFHQGEPLTIEVARKTACECITYRTARHPVEFANCGSVFKNLVPFADVGRRTIRHVLEQAPDLIDAVNARWHGKVPAAILIERAGLVRTTQGDAQISEKHANFIINRGRASATDIRILIQRVEEGVFKKFGVVLEPEIELVGFKGNSI